jgi:hypothetical protein
MGMVRVGWKRAIVATGCLAAAVATMGAAHSGHGSHGKARKPASAGESCPKGMTEGKSPAERDELRAAIFDAVGGAEHRLHHALWHAARGGLSAKESKLLVSSFGPSWKQMHPLCPRPGSDASAPDYNPVGEEFLYMHHQMISMVQEALAAAGKKCLTGWDKVPTPDQWPLPAGSKLEGAKSEQTLRQLQAWDATLQDRAWLSRVSLSQLGWAVEFSVHNNLHMRYATDDPPPGFEAASEIGGAPIPYDGKFPADWIYDRPGYDWLADPYGAAVNPVFWKIHGYVDNLLGKWLDAHGYKTIAEDCEGRSDCYTWHGQWEGEVHLAHADKATRPGSGHSRGPSGPSRETIEFNRKRMKLQHVGVLEGPRGAVKAMPPGQDHREDPLDFVDRSLCSGS